MDTKFYKIDNGSEDTKWSMLKGTPAPAIFRGWGATEIHEVPSTERSGRGVAPFMVKMPTGLWHYAHVDGRTSCYLVLHEGFRADSGSAAWQMHEHDNAMEGLLNLYASVATAETIVADYRIALKGVK